MSVGPVGVIGTGAMGMGVVRSLRRNGIDTLSRDVRDDANALAASLGSIVCESPRALVQRASIVLLLVVDDAQIEEVLFGTDGAACEGYPGAIVVVSSTVDPRFVAELAPRLASRGIALVDAPVSGGPARAADGTMTMMVSGARDARERCAPIFGRIARRVFEVGDVPGEAATFKVVNNLLAAANLAAGAEAIAFATRAGLDPRAMLDVIDASSGASWIVADRLPRALNGDAAVRAATTVLAKDIGLAVQLAERVGVDAVFARAARDAFVDAVAAGYGAADDSSLATRAAERAGITLAR
jgi:L-threonate 2-dehydrogenase